MRNEFESKLGDLLRELGELPDADRTKIEQVAVETQARHDRMKKTIGGLQDSLDYLRLSVKYLVFDLEATRRENAYLKNLLEDEQEADTDLDVDDTESF